MRNELWKQIDSEFEIKLNLSITMNTKMPTFRNFKQENCFALIFANEFYEKLAEIDGVAKGMNNLPWVKTDLINARATVEMMHIPQENVIELIDCDYETLQNFRKDFCYKTVAPIAKKEEAVFVYAYVAGHGCADVYQYFMLNDSNPKKVLFDLENALRQISQFGKGLCYVFAVYDICRSQAAWIKQLVTA